MTTAAFGVVDAAGIPRVRHREAMVLASGENQRLLSLLRALDVDHWPRPTDSAGWDVRAVVVHLVVAAEAQASSLEFLRQVRAGHALTGEIGRRRWVDGMNEALPRARCHLQAAQLPPRWEAASTTALRARARMPALVRRLPLLPLGELLGTRIGWQPLGYLFDVFTRDVDAPGRHPPGDRHPCPCDRGPRRTPHRRHGGRVASRHDEPFTLHLSGPAGGRYTGRGGATPISIDAIEVCRVLSGRAPGRGDLRHALPLQRSPQRHTHHIPRRRPCQAHSPPHSPPRRPPHRPPRTRPRSCGASPPTAT
jgi:hypothetical protein